jgi:alpha-galactosidase
LGGALGYEMHLPKSSDEVKAKVKEQVEIYRKYEDLILRGDYYSLMNPFENNYSAYYYTDEAKERILLSFLQHTAEEPKEVVLVVAEAIADAVYEEKISGRSYTGKELQEGVKVWSENCGCNSCMWYFVRK